MHSCIPSGINDLNNELSLLTVSLSLRHGNYEFLLWPRQPGAYPQAQSRETCTFELTSYDEHRPGPSTEAERSSRHISV